ncbi:MAG: hypothetical protein AAFQ13_02195 [Pseudomonadota bacterium]
MTVQSNIGGSDAVADARPSGVAAAGPLSGQALIALAGFALALLVGLYGFYLTSYSVHTDLAGATLSGILANTLGDTYEQYSVLFPPAEKIWFTSAAFLSEATGIRADLAVIVMTGAAVLFSTGLAFTIRRITVGASVWFLIASVAVLVLVPILYKNVFGTRAHMVVLGLWPYIVLRMSDPDGARIGWPLRLLLGLWMGATLSLKYLYALVVFLVELTDAAIQRRILNLFRIENLASGAIVGGYLLFWLVLDPAQREAIGLVVNAINANLASTTANIVQSALQLSVAGFFLLLAVVFKTPLRVNALGLAMVVAAIAAAWIQSRWYTHHVFPILMAYFAWLWMVRRHLKPLWLVAIMALMLRPLVVEFRGTFPYQNSTKEGIEAFESAGVDLDQKRVGLLTMHPAPFNQVLVSQGAVRWNTSVNNSYVATQLKPLDLPGEGPRIAPAVTFTDPGRKALHDDMLRLWEDSPPDALILNQSTSWPLKHIRVEWRKVFAKDERFNAFLSRYDPVFEHNGEWLEFVYLERVR